MKEDESFYNVLNNESGYISKKSLSTLIICILVSSLCLILLCSIANSFPPSTILTSHEARVIKTNNIFTYSVELEDPSNELYTFFFKDKIPSSYIDQINVELDFSLKENEYKYWGKYLLNGTKATVYASWDGKPLNFYIVKESMDNWNNKQYITQLTSTHGIYYQFLIEETDEYYFILENYTPTIEDLELNKEKLDSNTKNINGTITFELDVVKIETVYASDANVGGFVKVLEFNSKEYFVVYNPSSSKIIECKVKLNSRMFSLIRYMITFECLIFILILIIKRLNLKKLIKRSIKKTFGDRSSYYKSIV